MSTISNRVTDYFISLGEEDEFGVVYSEDGIRLKGCNRKNIESYEIKEGTEVIGVMSFSDCAALKQLTIPNMVKTIERYAFSGCTPLQQLTIPSSVEVIEVNPLGPGVCLTLIFDSPHFVFENEMLIDKHINNLIAYLGDKRMPVIPNWVKTIGDEAFLNCDFIQQIAIPNSVVSLGFMSFA